eukprot:3450927-Pleurochrysis_carterae.AAC.1
MGRFVHEGLEIGSLALSPSRPTACQPMRGFLPVGECAFVGEDKCTCTRRCVCGWVGFCAIARVHFLCAYTPAHVCAHAGVCVIMHSCRNENRGTPAAARRRASLRVTPKMFRTERSTTSAKKGKRVPR